MTHRLLPPYSVCPFGNDRSHFTTKKETHRDA